MSVLTWQEIRSRAVTFQHEWRDETREHAEAKSFWDGFFNVFGIPRRRVASFEKNVKTLEGQGFIDLFWKGTLLVEHKSRGKSLDKAYEQAKDYFPGLSDAELPQYLLVSDFERFILYDLDNDTKRSFTLDTFHKHIELFSFMAGYEKQELKEQSPVSIKAAVQMGLLHDKLNELGYSGHHLEVYLVRLLFCMFADDTGIFERNSFRDYILNETKDDGSDLAIYIDQLFYILNVPEDKRLVNINESLGYFPYVNGNLFEERLDIASFDSEMRKILLDCSELNWSLISPAIFGSLFQSVMNPEERRNLGAHYTSEENILKLIKPLFLDDLYKEFNDIKLRVRQKDQFLSDFHNKISSLTFFDPACGCGNFLIIAYRELRLLELEVVRELLRGQMITNIDLYVKVNVDQFYGVEIEEFPAQIAQVAMWLIDHQMNLKVSEEFGDYYVRLPLRKKASILNGDSLLIDWNTLLPAEECDFILGNPPFIGTALMDKAQKESLLLITAPLETKVLDFVSGWFIKSVDYIVENSKVKVAFVSTNSIIQGEQAIILWRYLFYRKNIHIHFAHQTFKWSNEASGKAAVYCVIVGMEKINPVREKKILYSYPDISGIPTVSLVSNINHYLLDAPSVFIESRRIPISEVPVMLKGSQPTDGGHYIFTKAEMIDFIKKEPLSEPYFKQYIGARELINGVERYILYLKDCSPKDLRQMIYVKERIDLVRQMRLESKKEATRKWAEKPTLLTEDRNYNTEILVIPRTTSENRKYIPIGYFDSTVLASDAVFQVANASLYLFGILNSAMHMAWTTTVCGRLKGDFRYSNTIVYNNFIFPTPSEKQKQKIEDIAEQILNIRKVAMDEGNTLADLYADYAMPPVLVSAHQKLDLVVDKAYRSKKFDSDNERVAYLFELYKDCVKSSLV